MARKKWVKKRLDPINDRLTELDQVNAKNASDIKDVDARAQAGIKKAQDSADAANQVATAAGDQAKKANDTAMTASGRIDNREHRSQRPGHLQADQPGRSSFPSWQRRTVAGLKSKAR